MDAEDEPQDRLQDESQDELSDTAELRRPAALRRPTVARRPRVRLRDRAVKWSDRYRSNAFVADSETVVIDERRHPLLLLLPGLRTLAGLLALATGPSLSGLLLFFVLTALWAQFRLRTGLRRTALLAAGAVAALLVLSLSGPLLCAVLLLGWFAEDCADWYTDRLVVSDRRIYRSYGVVIRHSPSISLTGIAYLDTAILPLGSWWTAGTLRLDSVAQRDAPLSRIDLLPDVIAQSHRILELRSRMLAKYPPQVY